MYLFFYLATLTLHTDSLQIQDALAFVLIAALIAALAYAFRYNVPRLQRDITQCLIVLAGIAITFFFVGDW